MKHAFNNSLCHLKICYYKISSEECLIHCKFRWLFPETTTDLRNNTLTNNATVSEDDVLVADHDGNTREPCVPNTWLWVVSSSEEGEAHFIVGNNIIDNVSRAHFNSTPKHNIL